MKYRLSHISGSVAGGSSGFMLVVLWVNVVVNVHGYSLVLLQKTDQIN